LKRLRKKFIRVEEIKRIKQVFDGLHDLDVGGSLREAEVGWFHQAQPVLR
jgi:hypothetical protein